MFQAKLFKNGNSVVVAIPEEIRTRSNLSAGDIVQISDQLTIGEVSLSGFICIYIPPKPKENPPHARKTSNKTR